MLTLPNIEDAYPSRGGRQAQLTERHDPVVYNRDLSASPIDANLVKSYEENGFVTFPACSMRKRSNVFKRNWRVCATTPNCSKLMKP